MTSSAMAQDNFDSLIIAGESDEVMLDADGPVHLTYSDDQVGTQDDNYVPVNLIPDEVRGMIKAWQLQRRERMEVSSTDAPASEDHEPLRTCSQTAPPKRFFRTFWRSVTRRMLKGDKQAVSASTLASTQ